MTLKDKEQEIVDTFQGFEDWMDRYQYLVELGTELQPLTDNEKNDQNIIHGCQSQAWLVCEEKDGKVFFRGESDAIIVKGIIAMLINAMSGATAQEIAESDFSFINEIGLREHLSPTRSNGLLAMVKRIKSYAKAIAAK